MGLSRSSPSWSGALPNEVQMSAIPSETIMAAALVLAVLLALLLGWFLLRIRRGRRYALRPIGAFDALRGLLGLAAEEGRIVHLTLGTGGIGGDQTAVTAAGLTVLRHLAEQGASLGTNPVVTVADPTALIVAQDVLYHAHHQGGDRRNYHPTDVQLIAPYPTAYAAGVQDRIDDERVAANVMVGHLDETYLLMGETGAQRGVIQVVGSDYVNAHPFMVATSNHVLLGEEIFAAGAYLTGRPEHVASLRVQDVLRVVMVLAILAGVLWKTVFG